MQLGQPLHVGTLMELALRKEEAAGKWQVGVVDCGRLLVLLWLLVVSIVLVLWCLVHGFRTGWGAVLALMQRVKRMRLQTSHCVCW
jgi:hypothetical protein